MSDSILLANVERLLKGRSADAVSRAAGAPDAIRNLRRKVSGETQTSWKLDTLEAIAAALGTSPWELLRPPGAVPKDEEFREYVREIIREEQTAAAVAVPRRRRR